MGLRVLGECSKCYLLDDFCAWFLSLVKEVEQEPHKATEWVSLSSFSIAFLHKIHYDFGNGVTFVLRDCNYSTCNKKMFSTYT